MINKWKVWLAWSLAWHIKAQTLIITTITNFWDQNSRNSLNFLSLQIFIFLTQTLKIITYSWSLCFIDQESAFIWWNSSIIRAVQAYSHVDGSLKLRKIQVVSSGDSCTKLQGKVKEEDMELLDTWELDFRELQFQVGWNRSSLFVVLCI